MDPFLERERGAARRVDLNPEDRIAGDRAREGRRQLYRRARNGGRRLDGRTHSEFRRPRGDWLVRRPRRRADGDQGDDVLILEPRHAVGHETKVQWKDAGGHRGLHPERERRDAARTNDRLCLRRDAIGGRPARREREHALVVGDDPQVHLLAGNAARPGARARIAEAHGERQARFTGSERRVQRLVDELIVESEVAREHKDRRNVIEPGQSVNDETHRDAIGPRCLRRAHVERERADHPWQDDAFGRCRDARRRHPAFGDAGVRPRVRIAADAEVHLLVGAALPRPEAHVPEAHRVRGGSFRRERWRRALVHELGVEREPEARWRDDRQNHGRSAHEQRQDHRHGDEAHERSR